MADIQALFNEAQKHFEAGRYEAAYKIWTDNVEGVDPAHRSSLHSNRGKALTLLGRAAEALECYGAALKVEPNLPSALRGRTAALLKMEDWAGAQASAQEAVAAHPADGGCASDVAQCHLKAGRAQEAVKAFESAIGLGDKSEGTRKQYGNALSMHATALINGGELAAAEALLDAAIAIEATEARLFNRGFIAHSAALKADEKAATATFTKKALKDLHAVARMNAKHPTAHRLLGELLLRVGDYPAARVALIAACNIDPQSTQELYHLGIACLKLSAPNDAKGYFERALAIDPAMAEAKEGLRMVAQQLRGGAAGGAAGMPPPPPPPPPPPTSSSGGSTSSSAAAAPAPTAGVAGAASDPAQYFCDLSTSDFDGFCGVIHPLAMLTREPFPAGVERGIREAYLSAAEFKSAMGSDKAAWYAQPKWKRDAKKKELKLF
jgi:tetratricopeptide (TPR) repeat protein